MEKILLAAWASANLVWTIWLMTKYDNVVKKAFDQLEEPPKAYSPMRDQDKIMSGKVSCEFDFEDDEKIKEK